MTSQPAAFNSFATIAAERSSWVGQLGMGVKILVDREQRRQLGVGERLRSLLREKGSGGESERDRKKTNLHSACIPERQRKAYANDERAILVIDAQCACS